MIAERIRAGLHLVATPRKAVSPPLTHAAPPSASQHLEPARAGATCRRHETAARRARVVSVDGTHKVELVLPAWEPLGAAAAVGMLHGVRAEVPVDDNVRGAVAGRDVVVVEVAVCAHCCGA